MRTGTPRPAAPQEYYGAMLHRVFQKESHDFRVSSRRINRRINVRVNSFTIRSFNAPPLCCSHRRKTSIRLVLSGIPLATCVSSPGARFGGFRGPEPYIPGSICNATTPPIKFRKEYTGCRDRPRRREGARLQTSRIKILIFALRIYSIHPNFD